MRSYFRVPKGAWISDLMRGKEADGTPTANYFKVDGKPLGEKNPKWLNNDYVKFIRFAQWRIEHSGAGILAFISDNGYLDNTTFRGMRQALMHTFTDIYLLDLHGNSNKKERCPAGSPDENVFDIQQGVAIGIFIKEEGKSGPARVHHADLWGMRESKDKQTGKYPWLFAHDVSSTAWTQLAPQSPSYMFVPQKIDLWAEYEQGWPLKELAPETSPGVVTGQDAQAIAFTRAEAEQLARQHDLSDEHVTSFLYRPFDLRQIVYDRKVVTRRRYKVMRHMLGANNRALITTRQTRDKWDVLVTDTIIGHKSLAAYDINSLFPLYLRSDDGDTEPTLFDMGRPAGDSSERSVNFSSPFIAELEQKLGLRFVQHGEGDLQTTLGPEDIFNYLYAIFYSPTYRERYAAFLQRDFPRVPVTSDVNIFRLLCDLGGQLVSLHLLRRFDPSIAAYPVSGDNRVEAVRYTPPTGQSKGCVWINKTQYFEGVAPEVWKFFVGGYQVAEKWLNDRKGRELDYQDLNHYMTIINVLFGTMRLMEEVDRTISSWPLV